MQYNGERTGNLQRASNWSLEHGTNRALKVVTPELQTKVYEDVSKLPVEGRLTDSRDYYIELLLLMPQLHHVLFSFCFSSRHNGRKLVSPRATKIM